MLKFKVLFISAVFGLVALSTQAFSQNSCNWNNGPAWRSSNIPAQYALTADQVTKIEKTRVKYNEKILPLQNELRTLRIEFRGYDSRYDAEIGKIRAHRKQIRNLEDKIYDLRLNARGEINKLLTKEQKLYFNNGGYGMMNSGHMGSQMMGPGNMGSQMMGSGRAGNQMMGSGRMGNQMMGSGNMGSRMMNMNAGCSGSPAVK